MRQWTPMWTEDIFVLWSSIRFKGDVSRDQNPKQFSCWPFLVSSSVWVLFFVWASVVSQVAFVFSLFVPHLSLFWCLLKAVLPSWLWHFLVTSSLVYFCYFFFLVHDSTFTTTLFLQRVLKVDLAKIVWNSVCVRMVPTVIQRLDTVLAKSATLVSCATEVCIIIRYMLRLNKVHGMSSYDKSKVLGHIFRAVNPIIIVLSDLRGANSFILQ